MRWTNVDLPAPAIPMVIMTIGFFFGELVDDAMTNVIVVKRRSIIDEGAM
jgi:hypothetical protein